MNVNPSRSSPPPCYGKEWSGSATECTGGPDITYTDAAGRHNRPRCDYFQLCGAETAKRKGEQILPAAQLLHSQPIQNPPSPPTPQQTPQAQPFGGQWVQQLYGKPQAVITPPPQYAPAAPSPPPQQNYQQQYLQQQQQQQRPPQTYYYQQPPQQYPQQQQQAYHGQQHMHYPAGQYQLNYMMPAYLTQPEVRYPGESWWAVLLREILRALGKSAGHTTAHFFDSTVLRQPPPP